jgi:arabinogalactan endo-1,4-beta-galactosidase
LTPYLVIFLSDDWADLTKQPAPKAWKDMSLEQRVEAVRDYARAAVTHFRAHGLTTHLYEIGNEIDYGICGAYPSKHGKKDPLSLAAGSWLDAAKLIQACQHGVKEADPDAKFMLHIAHWWDGDFCVAFFQFMIAHEAQVDYAGLSYYPSSGIGASVTMAQFEAVLDWLGKEVDQPIIIPETGYPSTSDFTGQFASWRHEVPGYPLSPEGQQKWLGDFLTLCRTNSKVIGVFYWSPEYYGEGMWKAFALFDSEGNARPAWKAFGARGD